MEKINLGDTQKDILRLMSDLEYRTVAKIRNLLNFFGAEPSVRRLFKQGYLERRPGKGTNVFFYEYRLSMSGIEVAIQAGVAVR